MQSPRDARMTLGGAPAVVRSRTTGELSGEALGMRVQALLQRVQDVERALTAQEWWLLGRSLPEARLLAEVSSLLAVARGELDLFMAQFFGRPMPVQDTDNSLSPLATELKARMPFDVLAARRAEVLGLLRFSAATLPAMRQYAEVLRTHAAQLGLTASAVDALGIVADRLGEAVEALQQPPE